MRPLAEAGVHALADVRRRRAWDDEQVDEETKGKPIETEPLVTERGKGIQENHAMQSLWHKRRRADCNHPAIGVRVQAHVTEILGFQECHEVFGHARYVRAFAYEIIEPVVPADHAEPLGEELHLFGNEVAA